MSSGPFGNGGGVRTRFTGSRKIDKMRSPVSDNWILAVAFGPGQLVQLEVADFGGAQPKRGCLVPAGKAVKVEAASGSKPRP